MGLCYLLLQRTKGIDCREYLDATDQLAHLYALQKEYARAEKIVEEIVPQKERILSPEDPSIFSSLAHLAELKSIQKKYDEAEDSIIPRSPTMVSKPSSKEAMS